MPKLILPDTDEEYVMWKKIVETSRGDAIESVTACMKYRLKRHFYVENDKLMCLVKKRPVLVRSHLPALLREYHDEASHPGRIGTIKKMEEVYASIPEHHVRHYIASCSVCNEKRLAVVSRTGQSLSGKVGRRIGTGVKQQLVVWSRVTVDLVDMTRYGNEDAYQWILVARDHVSKFLYAVSLKSKSGREVAAAVRDMFYRFGPSCSLVLDRTKEFIGIGPTIKNMMVTYFPATKVTTIKTKIPVGSGTTKTLGGWLETLLADWMMETGDREWPSGLQMIVHRKNNELCDATSSSPFKLFFFRDSSREPTEDRLEQSIENDTTKHISHTIGHMNSEVYSSITSSMPACHY